MLLPSPMRGNTLSRPQTSSSFLKLPQTSLDLHCRSSSLRASMPSVPGFLVTLLLNIVWDLLDGSTYINPYFRTALPSRACLLELFPLLGFQFTPGLLNTLLSCSPPSISWFESLSSYCPARVWAVYALVLKKRGCPDLLYIGSATSAKSGARARRSEYLRHRHLPKGVRKAFRDGYRITHTANLAWCKIPDASDIPVFRHIVVALEAALSCIFWAMGSRTKTYGFHGQCPWTPEAFSYNGLCSHNPLIEPVYGDLNLSKEELKRIAQAVKDKNRKYHQAYGKKQRENPTPEFKASQKARNAKQRPKTKANQVKAVADKTHHCQTCDYSARNNSDLQAHFRTKVHQRRVKEAEEGVPPNYCRFCDISFKFPSRLELHKKSKIHLANEDLANERNAIA